MVKDTRVTESGYIHWRHRALGSHGIGPIMQPVVSLQSRGSLSYISATGRPARRDLLNENRNAGTGSWRRVITHSTATRIIPIRYDIIFDILATPTWKC